MDTRIGQPWQRLLRTEDQAQTSGSGSLHQSLMQTAEPMDQLARTLLAGPGTAIDNRLQAHQLNFLHADLLLQLLLFGQTDLLDPQAVFLPPVMQNRSNFLERKAQGLRVLDQQQAMQFGLRILARPAIDRTRRYRQEPEFLIVTTVPNPTLAKAANFPTLYSFLFSDPAMISASSLIWTVIRGE